MKAPTRYFEFKLWWLNRVFRTLGFVLVIATDPDGPTRVWFSGKRAFDNWCLNLSLEAARQKAKRLRTAE